MICLAKAPLFEIVGKDGVHYIESEKELEAFKSKNASKIKEIHRNKGLGEMSPQAWKYIMGRESYTKIVPDDVNMAKEMLNVCFGKDTSLRKELLLDEAQDEETLEKVE